MFPHHADILQYLHSYAEKFNLMPHIQLNNSVKNVEKRGDEWYIECENGEEYTSSHVVITTGVHQIPNCELEDTILKGFTGKLYHAREIKGLHCKKCMVILTNKNGYLSCTFVLSTLGTEQRYKECARCVGYHPGGIEQ